MALSIRERLLQAVVARLEPVARLYGAVVLRHPVIALSRDDGPALALSPEADRIRDRVNDRVERELVLRLTAVTRSIAVTEAPTVADALLVAAHAALFAEPTFGGLALGLRELDTEWDVEDADVLAAALPARYEIRYRTLARDIAALG